MNTLATLPVIIAHGPPAVGVFGLIFLPFLVLGAVVPPLLFLRPRPSRSRARKIVRIFIAAVLNAYCFMVCANAAWYICSMEFYENDALTFAAMFTLMALFIGAETAMFLRRRQQCKRQTPPESSCPPSHHR